MLSFPVWCFVILAGFLMLCAALGIFVQWWERKRGNSPNRGATVDHIKRLPQ
jgi:uncharacterized iron-regulated membrane protein